MKRVHSSVWYAMGCFDGFGGLMYLPLDQTLFGQPIPIGEPGKFNFYKDFQNFLNYSDHYYYTNIICIN